MSPFVNFYFPCLPPLPSANPEAESKEKHGGRDPIPDLTMAPLQSRLQHNYYGQPYARVDLNPMPESTLQYSPVRDFGFGL
jgi:hypothetical protein